MTNAAKAIGPNAIADGISLRGRVTFLIVGLFLNSLLALLGSLLWGFVPYWPAFMVSNLAALYVRRWGIALAVLSPVATSLLFHDSPLGVYTPVALVQVLMFLGAMRAFKIDPGLFSIDDKVKFLLLACVVPSATGATVAWLLHHWFRAPSESLPRYVLMWTAENTLPALVPGLWLHRVLAETYRPEAWEKTRKPVSWQKRTLEYSAPWMLTLLLVGAMLVALMLQQAGTEHIGSISVPDFWQRFMDQAAHAPVLRVTALALSIAILYALGSAVQHAKQSWALVETIRRHLPNKRVSELLTSGAAVPVEQRVVTVMFTDIRGFTETSEQFAPRELVDWLNAYFTRMVKICQAHNGSVDKFIGDGIMVVFGLQGDDSGAREALRCALDMMEDVERELKSSTNVHPHIKIGAGIMTGLVTAGEIGSPERKQYTVIGSTVNVAARLESASKEVPSGCLPIALSESTAKHAGLLVRRDCTEILDSFDVALKGVSELKSAFAVKASGAAKLREVLG